MHPSVIQFACGHCQAQLTVPVQMAGVSGPCPKCGHTVTSPHPGQQQQQPVAPAWGMPQAPTTPPPAPAWTPQAPVAPQRPKSGPLQPMVGAMSQIGFPGLPPQQPAPAPVQQQPLPVAPQAPAPQPAAPAWNIGGGLPQQSAPPPQPPQQPAPSWGNEGAGSLLGGILGPQTQAARPITQPLSAKAQLPTARPAGMPPAAQAPLGGLQPPPGMQGLPPLGAPPLPGVGPLPIPGLGHGNEPSGPISRPLGVGGSRISLLARQLGVGEQANAPLPPAPDPLTAADFQTAAPGPSGPKNRDQHGAAMLQQNMRRGAGYRHASSGGKGRVAIAALIFLAALGALGYKFKPLVYDMLGKADMAALPPEEEPPVTLPTVTSPPAAPGFNPEAPATAAPPPLKAEPVVVQPAVPTPAVPDPVPVIAKAEPPAPQQPAQPEPVQPAVAVTPEPPVTTAMVQSPPQLVAEPPVPPAPPKALPVDPATQQVAALKTEPMNLPPPNPVSQPSPPLVEIGRSNSPDPVNGMKPGKGSPDQLLRGSAPELRGVPDEVKPAAEGLIAFLNASSWDERLKYTLHPEKMEEKGRSYYKVNADGPIEVDLIEYLRHDSNPQIGKGTHSVFVLSGRSWNYAFPVMVEQTESGARVDWLTFVEFKDDILRRYLESSMDTPFYFHVALRRSHYFQNDVPNSDKMDCFEIMSAMGTAHAYAFVPRDTPLARSLANIITWDKEVSYVVASLQFRTEPNGKWLELNGLPQLNWYTAADPSSPGAPTDLPAEETAQPEPTAKLETKKAGKP